MTKTKKNNKQLQDKLGCYCSNDALNIIEYPAIIPISCSLVPQAELRIIDEYKKNGR